MKILLAALLLIITLVASAEPVQRGIQQNLPAYVAAGALTSLERDEIVTLINSGKIEDVTIRKGVKGHNWYVPLARPKKALEWITVKNEGPYVLPYDRPARMIGNCRFYFLRDCDNLFILAPERVVVPPAPKPVTIEVTPPPTSPPVPVPTQVRTVYVPIYPPAPLAVQRSLPPIGTSESYAPEFRINEGSSEFRQGLQVFGGIIVMPDQIPGPQGPAGPTGPAGPIYCPPLPAGTSPPQPNL